MMRRVFLAINLPPEIKAELAQVIDKLQHANPRANIKWVEPENLHLTLHFLGSLDDGQIKKMIGETQNIIAKYNSFDMSLNALGCFPNARQPRIIFVETIEDMGVVKQIHAELRQILQNLGIETDHRPWQSHITLGRLKFPTACHGLDGSIAQLNFIINSIELMESQLLPKGPQYNILKQFDLVD